MAEAVKPKLAPALCLCLLAAGLLGWWQAQHQITRQLQQQLADLQQRLELLAALRQENQSLSETIAHHADARAMAAQQAADLQRLRQEATNLGQDLKSLQAEPPPWSFQGYVTPEATFQSALYAMSQGDLEAYLATLSVEHQKVLVGTLNLAPEADLPARLEEMRANVISRANHFSGAQIIKTELQPNAEAFLTVAVPRGTQDPEIVKIQFRQVDGNWRWIGNVPTDER